MTWNAIPTKNKSFQPCVDEAVPFVAIVASNSMRMVTVSRPLSIRCTQASFYGLWQHGARHPANLFSVYWDKSSDLKFRIKQNSRTWFCVHMSKSWLCLRFSQVKSQLQLCFFYTFKTLRGTGPRYCTSSSNTTTTVRKVPEQWCTVPDLLVPLLLSFGTTFLPCKRELKSHFHCVFP